MSAKRPELHTYKLTAIHKNGHVAKYEIKQVSRVNACREIIHMANSQGSSNNPIKRIVDTGNAGDAV